MIEAPSPLAYHYYSELPPIQRLIHLLPHSVVHPTSEVAIDRLPSRKIMRHRSPLDAFITHVHQRIDDLTQLDFTWIANRLFTWQQGFKDGPFCISEVARIGLAFHRGLLDTRDLFLLYQHFYLLVPHFTLL